jgi:membrane protein
VGVIGLVGFLWSGSGFFTILARNVNRANPNSKTRNFLEDRVLAIGMIALLALLLGLSFLSNTVTGLLPQIDLFYWRGIPLHETLIWRYIIKVIPFLVTLMLLIGLYRYIPRKKSRWFGVQLSAVLAALSWQAVTRLFTWLLQEGLVRFELVYGSLGTVAALMFWLYLISSITLFGAHLSAAIDVEN